MNKTSLRNTWQMLLLIGIVLQAIPSSFAQQDSITGSDDRMYVNHQKESILDHLTESKMSELELVLHLDSLELCPNNH